MATGYYLIDHPNHHGGHRGAGEYGWFYRPPRRNPIRCIGVHTAESVMDTVGPDTGAENVAGYLAGVDRPASYHELYDSDSAVLLLPWNYTAFGIRSHNSPTIQISFATATHYWGDDPSWDEAALQTASRRVAEMVRTYDIPLRWLTYGAAKAGHRGFVRHSTMDPSRRSDPGDAFPAGRFFDLIRARLTESDEQEEWFDMKQGEFEESLTKVLGEVLPKGRRAGITVNERTNTYGEGTHVDGFLGEHGERWKGAQWHRWLLVHGLNGAGGRLRVQHGQDGADSTKLGEIAPGLQTFTTKKGGTLFVTVEQGEVVVVVREIVVPGR